ncbi:LOW QUALITY PROTEIN: alpha-mannosidase 2C1-like [Haliotis rubra]|uniref:LOW QUALITY PROTEIN: alpha-mannosidase 2C1-like n=1 Tax=Haliotis rubra TaxID=36100 RepID=UPI001EE54929|nr:LOW QUALITY PROTEIN: alpha-mannosidase 2C1-like [Haliotis rubra]
MDHPVFKHRRTTLERAEKFISPIYFTDVNLRGKVYPKKAPLTKILHYATADRIPYEKAVKEKYTPAKVGESFGPTWSTHWFLLEMEVPADWEGEELIWNSHTEALVWVDGKPVQGLSGETKRHDYILTRKMKKKQNKYTVYIEMACNGILGVKRGNWIPLFYHEIPEKRERSYQALYTVNNIINMCDTADRSTYKKCREVAQAFLNQRNGESQHVIHAMGHAHIDSAWLSGRKLFTFTLRLSGSAPCVQLFTFSCSQAQQFQWIKDHYPSLYSKIQHFVKAGRFIPVGGSWVEMDGLIPSGEAFIRQFLYGQRYFQKEFGVTCSEFWLPDTFGYAAQLPQMIKMCGMTRFLTQKLSWNIVNKFPHHTFFWAGIDGTSVLTHFPPGDNYGMQAEVKELLYTVDNFQDKGRSARNMYLFGYGDGGHGPTEEMLEKLQRMKDVDGLPRVEMSTPDDFFTMVEKESGQDKLCTWRGELYLEMHNGTYTTHAQVKKSNRKCEFLLHDVELMGTIATVLASTGGKGYAYPSVELERIWKLFLLNQFHDVLPGSSIEIVYDDAHRYYKDVDTSGRKLLREAVSAVVRQELDRGEAVVVNTQAWERQGVVRVAEAAASPAKKKKAAGTDTQQVDKEGNTLALVKAVSCGVSRVERVSDYTPVSALKKGKVIHISNGLLAATVDSHGRLTSLMAQDSQRNVLSDDYPGNQLLLYDDVPLYWDAWDVMDYHLETRKPITRVTQEAKLVDQGPLRATIEVSFSVGASSSLKQKIILDAGCPYVRFETEVSWHECHKFLKVEFPSSMTSTQATYEIQFGHLQRPTHHYNTSWDSAKYEVCSHKWAVINEYGHGLAVLNDCKYGFATEDNVMRLSLLRSTKAPDANADMGDHAFTYALMPYTGTFQTAGVIQEAYNLNSPLQVYTAPVSSLPPGGASYFTVDTPQVILETVKLSEDDDGAMVLRLYEAFGGSTTATLSTSLPIKTVNRCNGLEEVEDEGEDVELVRGDTSSITISFTAFQIISLIVKF